MSFINSSNCLSGRGTSDGTLWETHCGHFDEIPLQFARDNHRTAGLFWAIWEAVLAYVRYPPRPTGKISCRR
jgi:hypothetical protein